MESVILQHDIIESLKVLPLKDCDTKSITIAINPNYSNGSDMELQHAVRKEIDVMVKQGLIKKNTMEIRILIGRNGNYKYSHKVYSLYTLNKI